MWPSGAACKLLKTNSGLSMREMWLRKSARQGAAWEGAECEVVDMVRVVVCIVRERCARRSLAAMVMVAGDFSEGVYGNYVDVVLQKCR